MKKIIALLFSILLINSLHAQSEWCGTDQMLQEKLDAHPEFAKEFMSQIENNLDVKLQTRKSGHKRIIPTVVHVIHFNGDGDVSNAQILDGLRIVNEDFNKQNADTIGIRSIFAPHSTSSDIEFRLAKKDPNGNCTEGITRTNSYNT